MKCTKCGYAYAVDPKSFPNLSDQALLSLFKEVSLNGTRYFTADQLYSAWSARVAAKSTSFGCAIFALMILAGLVIAAINSKEKIPFIIGAIIAGFVVLSILGGYLRRRQPSDSGKFHTALNAYLARHPKPEHLILAPSLHQPPPGLLENDIYAYGVDSVIVVNRDLLVDLLVKNNVHIETRSLIVSSNLYPKYVFERIQEIAFGGAHLKLYLLHDLNCAGFEADVRNRIAGPLGITNIIDLGLSADLVAGHKHLNFIGGGNESVLVDHLPPATLVPVLAGAVLGGIGLYEWWQQELASRNAGSGADLTSLSMEASVEGTADFG